MRLCKFSSNEYKKYKTYKLETCYKIYSCGAPCSVHKGFPSVPSFSVELQKFLFEVELSSRSAVLLTNASWGTRGSHRQIKGASLRAAVPHPCRGQPTEQAATGAAAVVETTHGGEKQQLVSDLNCRVRPVKSPISESEGKGQIIPWCSWP